MSRPLATVALLALFAAALCLRITGIDSGLPYRTEPDVFVVAQAEVMRPGYIEGARADDPELTAEAASAYPDLFARVLLALRRAAPRPPPVSLDEALARAGDAFLRARWVAAILGALLVPATFLLARRFLPAGASLFAAALVATSLLHVNFSQQARPHVVVATTGAFALVAALRARANGGLANHLLAFAATVVAIGSLHSGVLFLLPLMASHLLVESLDAAKRTRIRRVGVAAGIGVAAFAIGLYLFYPLSASDKARSLSESSVVRSHLVELEHYDGSGFARLFEVLTAQDPVLLALSLVGLVVVGARMLRSRKVRAQGLESRTRDVLVVASFGVPYFLAFGTYGHSSARYAIPLLPILALLAAFGTHAAFQAVRARALHAIALLALPTWASLHLVLLRREPDSCERTAQWLQANASSTDAIWLAPGLDLPLARTPETLSADASQSLGALRQPWFRFQTSLGAAIEGERWSLRTIPFLNEEFAQRMRANAGGAIKSLGAQFVIVSLISDGELHPMTQRIRVGLADAGAERVTVIAPSLNAQGLPRPLIFQETRWPEESFLRLVLRAEMAGPAIEIYRLRK